MSFYGKVLQVVKEVKLRIGDWRYEASVDDEIPVPIGDGLTNENDNGELRVNIGKGLKMNSGAVWVDAGTGLIIENNQVQVNIGEGLSINEDGKVAISVEDFNINGLTAEPLGNYGIELKLVGNVDAMKEEE